MIVDLLAGTGLILTLIGLGVCFLLMIEWLLTFIFEDLHIRIKRRKNK